MISIAWRKRLSILQNRLYLYPAPEAMPHTRMFWLAMGLVTIAVALFSGYFITYLLARHNAFLTNAEDFGIMDQAIWNTVHGNILHQTICNTLSDTNCYSPDGIMRFAIHFEPILFPISLLYLLWPTPKTLLVVQTLIVASGAYPAFWLARLRLRNDLAGVAIALLYLLYPAQQQATAFDFHAVTFTAALLLYTLYFMYTRRTVWLFVFAILSMACKEDVPLVVMMFGLWSMVFQRRWRSGLLLVVLAMGWVGLGFTLIRLFSPTGQPLLASRYDALGRGPLQWVLFVLRHPKQVWMTYIWEGDHRAYLHILFAPGGYFPPIKFLPPLYLLLLAPWVLVMALPVLALNMLSSSKQMYSGLFQYNASIVPILIFATIESIVLILWLAQIVGLRLSRVKASTQAVATEVLGRERRWRPVRFVHTGLLVMLLSFALFSAVRVDYGFFGQMPFAKDFDWPQQTQHEVLAQQFIDMIPQDASVSAQTRLVPHMSHRKTIYMFPYGIERSDYVFLDVTGDIYPYFSTFKYVTDVKKTILGGDYGVLAAKDGYLLLKRGMQPPAVSSSSIVQLDKETDYYLILPDLPESFCSFIYGSTQKIQYPVQATFTTTDGSIELLGGNVDAGKRFSLSGGYMSVTTYWQVKDPISSPLQTIFVVRGSDQKEYFASNDVPAFLWCQSNMWKSGQIVQVTSRVFGLQFTGVPKGLANLSVSLLPLAQPWSTIMDVKARVPLRSIERNGTVRAGMDTNTMPLMEMTIVP